MDFEEYQFEARQTQRKDLALWAIREHALYGLASEVGEVLGMHQKIHQGHPIDEGELILEIGDVLWFVAELCDSYGFSMDEAARANIAKLRVRYKGGFTVDESEHRNNKRESCAGERAKLYARRKEQSE